MAVSTKSLLSVIVLSVLFVASNAQLSPTFYSYGCPNLRNIVRVVMVRTIRRDPTLGAGVLRLFFHDCFVNGCDASVLLDDTPTVPGEKNAPPNQNSLRGFEVIDDIKKQVEIYCPKLVSCADILALASRDAVNLLGGPYWNVLLGRRDTRTVSQAAATSNLPGPGSSISSLLQMFGSKGLNAQDLTALSGAHTIGSARCSSFRPHIYNDPNINAAFAAARKQTCPAVGGDGNLQPLDIISPVKFDNSYYQDLMAGQGLLHSDQELFNNGPTDPLVGLYAGNPTAFYNDFANAMIKMGNISPLIGFSGEIRNNCRRIN